MPLRVAHLFIAISAFLVGLLGSSRGSAIAQPMTAPREGQPAGGVEEAPTRIFYSRDKDGKLVPIVGFTLKDFDRLLNLDRQNAAAAPKPATSLDALEIRGDLEGATAKLDVKVSVTVEQPGWVRVPLRLGNAVLEEASCDGEVQSHFVFEDNGYACWIRDPAAADKPVGHILKLKMLAKIETIGVEQRLALETPRCTSSNCVFTTPGGSIRARSSDAVRLEPRVAARGDNRTEISLSGVQDSLDVTWWRADRPMAPPATVLESTASVLLKVEGQSLRWDATFNVRCVEGTMSSLKLQLPAEAKLSGGVSVRTVDGEISALFSPLSASPNPGVEVRFEKPVSGSVELRVSAVRTPDDAQFDRPIDLGGFMVLGAGRQTGWLAVVAKPDWQLEWVQRQRVIQVENDDLPESLQSAQPQMAFEFASHPVVLTARVARRQPRVSVEPSYSFVVHPDRVEYEARFKYHVRRAGVRELKLELPPEWEVEASGLSTFPPSLIDFDSLVEEQTAPLTVPLRERQMGQFDLTIRGAMKLPVDATTVTIQLPSKMPGLGEATVDVQPANNVALVPQTSRMRGLTRTSSPPRASAPGSAWQQEPLTYRTDVATAVFVADLTLLPRDLQVDVDARVRLTTQAAEVEQTLSYRVLHEPVKEITLQVPRRLRTAEPLDVWFDDQPLAWGALAALTDSEAEISLLRLPLPQERIGPFKFRLRYRLPADELEPATSAEQTLPLVMPSDGRLMSNRLAVTPSPGLKVDLRSQDWTRTAPSPGDFSTATGVLHATAERPRPSVRLIVDRRDVQENVRVDRAWLQTWLTSERRRDRVCWLTSGDAKSLLVELPEGVDRTTIEVFVDGREANRDLLAAAGKVMVSVPLGAATGNRRSTVEMLYRFLENTHARREPLPLGWKNNLEAPRLAADVQLHQVYWEIILPGDEHLLVTHGDATSEFSWDWNGLAWSRRSAWSTPQLEDWVGANHAAVLPPGVNRYLFSHWGSWSSLRATTVGRATLVAASSLVVLVIGLLWVYVPAFGHRLVVFAAAIAVVGAVYAFPDVSPLLGQAAALGVVLVGLAAYLRRNFLQRSKRGMVVRTPASSIRRSPTDGVRPPSATGDYQGSTADASIVRLPAGELRS